MQTSPLPSPDVAREILARTLAESPADRTEISWTEAIHRQERSSGGDAQRSGRRPSSVGIEPALRRELNLVVRVTERGREGVYRAAALDRQELATAIRAALADARLAPPPAAFDPGALPEAAPTERSGSPAETSAALWDAEIADLSTEEAKALLAEGLRADESAHFAWTEGRIGYAATGATPQVAALTGASLELRAGRGPATGSAQGVARMLGALAPGCLLDLARDRRADPALGEVPASVVPLVLSPKAAARLAIALARTALDSRAVEDALARGTKAQGEENPTAWPLFGRLGDQIASTHLTLLDDPTDPAGLALPFDSSGTSTYPIELIAAGIFRAAALTTALARRLDLPPGAGRLPLAIDIDQAAPLHLVLRSSDPAAALPLDALLAAADDGLWIAALTSVELYDRSALRFRAIAHGVRRIVGGKVGPALPNLVWEAGLLEVLSRVSSLGADRIAVPHGSPWLGATLAPALGIEPVFQLRPV